MENRASIQTNVVIMGAAGRDFHNFNVVFRANPDYRVIAIKQPTCRVRYEFEACGGVTLKALILPVLGKGKNP